MRYRWVTMGPNLGKTAKLTDRTKPRKRWGTARNGTDTNSATQPSSGLRIRPSLLIRRLPPIHLQRGWRQHG